MPINSRGEFYKDPTYEPGVINTTNTQPNTEIPYVSPTPSPIPNVAGLSVYNPNILEETPSENKAQSLTEQLQSLNESLIGESEYRTGQETTQDISGLTKTKTDLSNQLKILQNEALAIPQQAQQMAQGRGMTAGGLAPLEMSKLRENNIKALTTSALLEAANSNLATANDLVDRAVKARYDPIREDINVKLANLQLIIQSPDYTREEKNRATQMQQILDAKKNETDKKELEQKEIWGIATALAQKGADSLTLQKVQQATTKEEALQIAGQSGLLVEKETPSFQYFTDDTGNVTQYNELTGETKNLGRVDKATKGVGGVEDGSVDYWVDLLSKGQTQIYNIPMDIRNTVIQRAGEKGMQIISPTFAKASADAQSSFNSAINQLTTIETNANKVITAQGLTGLLGQGYRSTTSKIPFIGAALQPQFKLYNDSVDAFTSMLARAVGEKGMLTDLDIARVKKALPQPTDTAELAKQKLDTFKSLLASIKNGAVDAYSAKQLGITVKASDITTGPINASQTDLDYINTLNLSK